MGWRHQIPVLVEMGCRVVAPDMMGYGGTVSRLSSSPIRLSKYASSDEQFDGLRHGRWTKLTN